MVLKLVDFLTELVARARAGVQANLLDGATKWCLANCQQQDRVELDCAEHV